MERESFVDPEIAKIMNDSFINIKVDREERPDVDKLYMTFVVVSLTLFRFAFNCLFFSRLPDMVVGQCLRF